MNTERLDSQDVDQWNNEILDTTRQLTTLEELEALMARVSVSVFSWTRLTVISNGAGFGRFLWVPSPHRARLLYNKAKKQERKFLRRRLRVRRHARAMQRRCRKGLA